MNKRTIGTNVNWTINKVEKCKQTNPSFQGIISYLGKNLIPFYTKKGKEDD